MNPTTSVHKLYSCFWSHSQKPCIETLKVLHKHYDTVVSVFNAHRLASLFRNVLYATLRNEVVSLLHLFQCIRAERLRKHMLLLCNNAVPMCVEVLLCPVCQCGTERAKNPEIANIPSPSDHLLEQWTVSVVHVR